MVFKVVKNRQKRPKKPWFSYELQKQKSLLDKKRKIFLKNSTEKNEKDLRFEKKS